MFAVTVRQPWAKAIITQGKDVENRTWYRDFRGPLAIHAGKQLDESQVWDPMLVAGLVFGAAIGVVTVVGWHRDCSPLCSPWARPGQWHVELVDPIPLEVPVPCRGQQGLWTLEDRVEANVLRQLGFRKSGTQQTSRLSWIEEVFS